jgi:hypothetical protein
VAFGQAYSLRIQVDGSCTIRTGVLKSEMSDSNSHAPVKGGIAREIEEIAFRLSRLSVSRLRPEFFFEERSELVHALRQIARK